MQNQKTALTANSLLIRLDADISVFAPYDPCVGASQVVDYVARSSVTWPAWELLNRPCDTRDGP
jgi:hypothetical protein